MAKKFREELGRRALRRKIARPATLRPLRPLNDAKRIGFLIPTESEKEFLGIMGLARELRQQGVTVESLVLWESKEIPPYLTAREGVTILQKRGYNWIFRPKDGAIGGFESEHFDFLINFSRSPHLPLEWVTGLTAASIKVGFYQDALSLYDLQFEIPANDTHHGTRVDCLKNFLSAEQLSLEE